MTTPTDTRSRSRELYERARDMARDRDVEKYMEAVCGLARLPGGGDL